MAVKLPMLFVSAGLLGGHAQKVKTMGNKGNTLICDVEKGICEMPAGAAVADAAAVAAGEKPVKIVYFTDPICSSCWGIEPQLRKLKLEYGHGIYFEYRMGGLLPDWSYNSGGISKPSDVASHWDEVSRYYDMAIDGDVWLTDPLDSSYPPSIAFKAAQLQDTVMVIAFLRVLREKVFLQKKNITKWEHIAAAAAETGLDVAQLKTDFEGSARRLFEEDLQLAARLMVRGFPSVFVTDGAGNSEFVYGYKPYDTFVKAVEKMAHGAVSRQDYAKDWQSLFARYPTFTLREFAELSGIAKEEALEVLSRCEQEGVLDKLVTKNGNLWIRR